MSISSLQHSPADITRRALILLGLGTLPTSNGIWPVSAESEPDAPDECVTVYTTVGKDHGRTMIDGEMQQHYGIQIRVRSRTPTVGWVKADTVATTIAARNQVYDLTVVIESSVYLVHCFANIGDVLPLGKEAPTSKRNLFTINALLSVKQIS